MLFDHHMHSKYSVLDSTCEISDIITAAKRRGLGGIAISDHDAIEGSLLAAGLADAERKGLIIIPAMEISSLDGHIVALGIRKPVERGLGAKETLDRIHKLGGIAIAAHPYDRLRSGVGDLCWKLDFDAVEVNGRCLCGNGTAAKAAKDHGKPLVGGSDAHSLAGIGAVATEVAGGSAEEIIECIKTGRCRPVWTRSVVAQKTTVGLDKLSRRCKKAVGIRVGYDPD